jgi:hypothetical protein
MMEVVKGPFFTYRIYKQMLADVETMSSLLKPTASKGIGNPIYESMNLEIDEVALGTYLDILMNASTSEMVDFRTMEGARIWKHRYNRSSCCSSWS